MNANDVRQIINQHPEGVVIRLIDGTKYDVPHRDWVWLTPLFGAPESRAGRYASCFGVYHDGVLKWVNCLLIAEIAPMMKRPRGGEGGSRRRKKAG